MRRQPRAVLGFGPYIIPGTRPQRAATLFEAAALEQMNFQSEMLYLTRKADERAVAAAAKLKGKGKRLRKAFVTPASASQTRIGYDPFSLEGASPIDPFSTNGEVQQGSASTSVVFFSTSQLLFRPEEFVLSRSSLEGTLQIDDVRIGKNSIFLSNAPIPVEALQDFKFDHVEMCNVGQRISIHVTNLGRKPVLFSAALRGRISQ
jgi:hypothetical protein